MKDARVHGHRLLVRGSGKGNIAVPANQGS